MECSRKGIVFITTFFFAILTYAQDQKVADSLISVYESGLFDDSLKHEILQNISFHHNDLDKKLQYAEELIDYGEKSNRINSLFSGYYLVGNTLRLKGNLDEALKAYLESIKYAQDRQDAVGTVYLAIGDIYSINSNHQNSITYYNRAIEILRSEQDSVNLASALLNLGDEYFNANKLDSALSYFQESGEIFRLINYEAGLAYNLGNVGLVYASQGNNEQAEKNIVSAIEVLERLGNYYPISVYLTYMADIYMEKGDETAALDYVFRSLEIAERNNLKEQISDANLKLSEIYDALGNFEESLRYYQDHVVYRDSVNNIQSVQEIANLRTAFEVSQKQIEVDLLNQQKRNQQIIAISLAVIVALFGVLLVTVYRNSQRKIRLNRELEALNATKDKFFSIISHDLRGPVSAFSGISRIIKMYLNRKDYKELEEMTDQIDHSAKSLSDLLDNLLSWAVQQQGEFPYNPEELDLANLTETIKEIFTSSAAEKNIEIEVDLENSIRLWADKNSTLTILRNLVGNALKFTPDEGEIVVKGTVEESMACIAISDTGVGMSEEIISNLFQVSAKKSTYGTSGEKGLGLGLQLVNEFVNLNKGTISVESEEGKGTTFIVKLPLA
jgi:signal transduction histidine kinase